MQMAPLGQRERECERAETDGTADRMGKARRKRREERIGVEFNHSISDLVTLACLIDRKGKGEMERDFLAIHHFVSQVF